MNAYQRSSDRAIRTDGRLLKAAGHPLVAYLTLWLAALVAVTS